MLIETDIIISLVRRNDKQHYNTLKILKKYRKELLLSPYSLSELDLLIWSDTFRVKDKELFFKLLGETIKFYNVDVVKPRALHVAKAYELRLKYDLSFFNSLHAATAIIEKTPLLSYDRVYGKVKELNYINPSTLV